MIDGLKPYPAMKDSGVPWLGEVPEHWEVRRLGALLHERKETNDDLRVTDVLSVLRDRGVIPYAEKGNIGNKKSDDITRYKIVRPNDIVVNCMNVIIGSVGLSKYTGCLSPVYYVLTRRAAEDEPRYLNAYFQTKPFQQSLVRIGNGILAHRMRIPMELLKCEPFPRPPAAEQAAIVRFLDHADRRIRRYIRAKQKLIKLLEEQKQAIIHRAVTRGLDPNVRLKPSGVEWLGDVPEHWEVLPLCAIARPRKQTNQAHRELLSVYLGRGVIPFSAVEEKRTNPTSEDLSKYQAVELGDFVLNNQQAWRGSVGVSRHQGIVSPAYLVLALDGRLIVEFADRLLPGRAMVAQYLVSSKGVGSIQRNLYWPHLRRVAVLVPPAVEQAAIARYLDDATASLATTIERAGCEIDLLREYRTRLIADVVTGKLDVREAAARLPAEVEEPESLDEIEAEGDTDEAGADDADAVSEEAEA